MPTPARFRRCRSKNCLLIQTAQEQVVVRVRRQFELPAQRLAQMPADFLPPGPRKHLAALHVQGKGQTQRPLHLKTRRDRCSAICVTRSSRNFSTPASRAVWSTTTIVPAAMSPSRWKRSLSDAAMKPHDEKRPSQLERPPGQREQRNQRHGIHGAKHVPQHGLPGADRLALDRDHPNAHGAFARRLAVPHRLQQAAVEPLDKEQDDQRRDRRNCPAAPGSRTQVPVPSRPLQAPGLG